MPSLGFLALVAAVALLVLLPTRRLFLAGWTSGPLTGYFLAMILLGLLVAELRAPARYLIPILVLAYIAPFVTARAGIARLRDRMNGRIGGSAGAGPVDAAAGPPVKNVTPPDEPTDRADSGDALR